MGTSVIAHVCTDPRVWEQEQEGAAHLGVAVAVLLKRADGRGLWLACGM